MAVDDPNGHVWAWGRNGEGQLGNAESGYVDGDPIFEDTAICVHVVNDVSYLEGIISVSAGERHSMALEKYEPNDPNLNGCVFTWGDNEFLLGGGGVLGVGTTDGNSTTPVCVHRGLQDYNEPNHVSLKHIVAISAGWDHSMALEKLDPCDPNLNGRVYTWGSNGPGWGNEQNPNSVGGRLGDGTIGDSNSSSTPVLVLRGEQQPEDPNNPDPNLTRIVAISAGEGHSMALDEDGYVYAWGDNYFGQLGSGTYDPCTSPVRVVGRDLDNNGSYEPNEGYLENIVAG